jgi:hypothetical protein
MRNGQEFEFTELIYDVNIPGAERSCYGGEYEDDISGIWHRVDSWK